MKKNKKRNIAIITAALLLVCAVAVTVAIKYKKSPPAEPSETKQSVTQTTSTETQTQTDSESSSETGKSEIESETTEEKTTKNESASEKTTEALNIVNSPALEGGREATDFEKEVFSLINKAREEKNLPVLKWNDNLHTLASVRADEITTSFSHTRPDGGKPSSVLEDYNLTYSLLGECLAKGAKDNREGPSLIANGFINSTKHAEIMFSPEYVYCAVAAKTNSDGEVYVAVLFCNP